MLAISLPVAVCESVALSAKPFDFEAVGFGVGFMVRVNLNGFGAAALTGRRSRNFLALDGTIDRFAREMFVWMSELVFTLSAWHSDYLLKTGIKVNHP